MELTHKAMRDEVIVVLAAVFTQPIVKGTYGIVPPHEKPSQPVFRGAIICRMVSKGAVLASGNATPKVMLLVPVHPA